MALSYGFSMKRRFFYGVLFAVLAGFSAGALASASGLSDGLAQLKQRQFEAAYATLLPEAEKGNSRAALEVGKLLLTGRGVAKDEEAAVKWLLVAADAGNRDAQYMLGAMSMEGIGLPKDRQVALTWLSEGGGTGGCACEDGFGDSDAVQWNGNTAYGTGCPVV